MKNVKPGHSKPIVCLDAGHYGKFNRSPAVNTYYESEMNWKLHNYLASELESYGIQVKKTRAEQGKDLSLAERGRASNGCDLFLSIHSNAVGSEVNETVDYPVVFVPINGSGDEIGKKLVDCITTTMGTKQKGYSQTRKSPNGNWDYYGVIKGAVSAGTPGLILEHSFHTNTRATRWLLEDANLKKLAKAEAAVIAEYYGMTKTEDKPAEKPVEKPVEQPKSQTCTATLPVIRFGDKGATVKVMQTLLDFHGYPCANGGADGEFGNGTKEALKFFQAEKDLDTDAVCGPLTWAKLLEV